MDFNAIAGKASELLNAHGDQMEAAAEQVDAAVDKTKDLIPGGEGRKAPAAAPAGR